MFQSGAAAGAFGGGEAGRKKGAGRNGFWLPKGEGRAPPTTTTCSKSIMFLLESGRDNMDPE